MQHSNQVFLLTNMSRFYEGYGSALFATAFTETAISLNVVDRLDESQGPGAMVLIGQGFSNIVSAVMGGMGSSGVVTSSVLADRTFGTTCLSTFFTGFIIFVCIYWAFPVIDCEHFTWHHFYVSDDFNQHRNLRSFCFY